MPASRSQPRAARRSGKSSLVSSGRSNFVLEDALLKSAAYKGDDITERFAEHVDTFVDWMDDEGPLRISEERLTHLARIAAFSPAISFLRAFWTTFPDSRGQVPERLVDLCFGELRSYFNRRTVRAIVERSAPGRTRLCACRDRVLRACTLSGGRG